MSYVAIYSIAKTGDASPFAHIKNNHGFAPLVWERLRAKYGIAGGGVFDSASLQKLWSMVRERPCRLSPSDALLLVSTYDRAWVPREYVRPLIAACREFHDREIAGRGLAETVLNSAKALETLLDDADAIGCAFNMCSAVEAFWHVEGESADEDRRPYNVLTDAAQPRGEYEGTSAWSIAEYAEILPAPDA